MGAKILTQNDSKEIDSRNIGRNYAALQIRKIISSERREAFPYACIFQGIEVGEHPRTMICLQNNDRSGLTLRQDRINHILQLLIYKLYLLCISLLVFFDRPWKFICILEGE